MNQDMLDQVRSGRGFIAALDQSGGSTPQALASYGIPDSAYSDETEMFDLIHRMRTRIVTSPAFTGDRILAAILFEQTMDRPIEGLGSAEFLWTRKHVVPFLKVDDGLAEQEHGAQVMKPIPDLDGRLVPRPGARRLRHQDALGDPHARTRRGWAPSSTSSSTWPGRSWTPDWSRSSSPRSTSTAPRRPPPRGLLKDRSHLPPRPASPRSTT